MKTIATISAIRFGTGITTEPYGWFLPPDLTIGEVMHDLRRPIAADLLGQRRELGQPFLRKVGPERVADRAEQCRQPDDEVAGLRRLVAEGDEDLLLASGPSEVVLAGRLPDPRVGQRVRPVEVMRPDADRPARPDPETAVVRVRQRLGDVDVDPTDSVDHRHEAGQVDLRVVVDRHPEQRPDGVLERPRAALRELGPGGDWRSRGAS